MLIDFLIIILKSIGFLVGGVISSWILMLAILKLSINTLIKKILLILFSWIIAILLGVYGVIGALLVLVRYKENIHYLLPALLIPYFLVLPENWNNNHIMILGISAIMLVIFQIIFYFIVIKFYREDYKAEWMSTNFSNRLQWKNVFENIMFVILIAGILQVIYTNYIDHQLLTWMYNLPVFRNLSLMILSTNVMVNPIFIIFADALEKLLIISNLGALFIFYKFKYTILTIIYYALCMGLLLLVAIL